jgi:hypothetical protein
MVMLNAQNAQSEDDFGSSSRPVAAKYHMAILSCEEKGSKKKGTPGVEVEFQVVCDGLNPVGKRTEGQTGKTITAFMSCIGETDEKTKTCLTQLTRFAICSGVLSPGEEKEPDWSEANGRELIVEVEPQTFTTQNGQEREGVGVGFCKFWRINNKEVANIPKDATTPGMQALGRSLANGNGNGHATASTAATATATATKPRTKYANL